MYFIAFQCLNCHLISCLGKNTSNVLCKPEEESVDFVLDFNDEDQHLFGKMCTYSKNNNNNNNKVNKVCVVNAMFLTAIFLPFSETNVDFKIVPLVASGINWLPRCRQ